MIAHCAEEIDWISKQCHLYKHVFLYTKCGKSTNVVSNLKNVSIIPTANIGSCDFVFLTHIINNYEVLEGYITFAKGRDSSQKFKILHPSSKYFKSDRCDLSWSMGDSYTFTNNTTRFEFHKLGLPHGEWMKDCFGERMRDHMTTYTRVAYGGWWSVHTDRIKKYPINMYKRMRDYQRFPNEEVDHYIERSWGMLMTCADQNEFTFDYFEALPPPNVGGVI